MTELAHDDLITIANTALSNNQLQAALDVCLLGVSQHPGSPQLLSLLGCTYARGGDFVNAESSFRQALCQGAASASVHAGLGAVLAHCGKHHLAEEQFRHALFLQTEDAEIWFNYGCTLNALCRRDEALAAFQHAIAIDPSSADAHLNFASTLAQLGRWSESLEACRRASAIAPESWRARLIAASAQLALGCFAEGWDNYEARIESQRYYTDRLGLRPWQGPGDTCRSLVVIPEQGIGTQIMFASCVADLAPHVEQVTLGCDPRLIALFRRSFPHANIVAAGAVPVLAKSGRFDAYAMAGSLPRHFRRALRDFPGDRYLIADPLVSERWRRRLASFGPGVKIGVSWRGGAGATDARHRSVPPNQWQSLVELPGIEWINLQYDAEAAEIERWKTMSGGHFHHPPEVDLRYDLDNTSALVSQLDLVISVVNSTVHLTGALGVPTWTIVPAGGEWRWLASGDDCIWHQSVRLVRQKRFDDWSGTISELATRLTRKLNAA